jgi:hypothetical protein
MTTICRHLPDDLDALIDALGTARKITITASDAPTGRLSPLEFARFVRALA